AGEMARVIRKEARGDRGAGHDMGEIRTDHANHHRIALDAVTAETAALAHHELRAIPGVALAEKIVVEREVRGQRRLRHRVRAHLVASERNGTPPRDTGGLCGRMR